MLLTGVLLPSGPDLAIGVSPVIELLRLRLLCSSPCVQYVEVIKKKKTNRFQRISLKGRDN